MTYIPITQDERTALLDTIGVSTEDDLFRDIPEGLLNPAIEMPPALPESSLRQHLQGLADANRGAALLSFAGYGAYDHFIPAAVDALASRGEFVTSYTPYQAEISQGNLQAVYEYQTMMADLCGLEVSNASLYDGATALFEAATMAVRIGRRRPHLVLDGAIHPAYRETVESLGVHLGLRFTTVETTDGRSQDDALLAAMQDDTAAVLTANPNVFGEVRSLQALADGVHAQKALLVCSTHPLIGGVIDPPGRMGADLVCGEGQPLGLPVSYGGPFLGFIACRKAHARSMPGRLVGATVDAAGRRAFCLALQTREQHIRREKATSNICTNQALCALRAAVHLGIMGETGIRRAAENSLAITAYARERVAAVPGCEMRWEYPCFNEFVVHTAEPAAAIIDRCMARGVVPGVDLSRAGSAYTHELLMAFTEQRSTDDVDTLCAALAAATTDGGA